MEQQRLNKYIAACGICSRREADQLIQDGLIMVNGHKAIPGEKVDGNEEISVKGKLIGTTLQKVVLAFYKPIGVTVTKSDPHADKTIMQYIDYPVPVTYAGRLDRDSEGLILLTNDGQLIDALMRGRYGHEKEYLVKLNRPVKAEDIQKLSQGVFLRELNRKTRECEITQISKYSVRMVITEGMNRQIRRMWKTAGYEVQALKRVRVGNILLGHLAPGTYRVLSEAEREELYRLTFHKETKKRGDEA